MIGFWLFEFVLLGECSLLLSCISIDEDVSFDCAMGKGSVQKARTATNEASARDSSNETGTVASL
jgi:hypothetical protein